MSTSDAKKKTLHAIGEMFFGTATHIHRNTIILRSLNQLSQLTIGHRIRRSSLLHGHDDFLSVIRINLGLLGVRLSLGGGADGGGSAHE